MPDSPVPPYTTLAEYEGYRFQPDGQVYTTGGDPIDPGVYLDEGEYWKPLTRTPNKEGYPTVKIAGKTVTVHTLICRAFHGPKPFPEAQACHTQTNDRTDCRAENLRWGTPTENRADQKLHGSEVKGDRHWKATVSDEDLEKVFEWHSLGWTQDEIAAELNMSQPWVSRVLNKKRRSS